jgi:DNA topoisomerase IB
MFVDVSIPNTLHSYSKVEQSIANAFLKTLFAITAAHEDPLSKTMLNNLKAWSEEAVPFVTQFKLGLPNYKQMVKLILAEDYANDKLPDRIHDFATAIYVSKVKYKKELDLTKDQIQILDSFSLWLRRDSEAAHTRLNKLVPIVNEPSLTKLFVSTEDGHVEQQDQAITDIKKLVKKLTGRTGTEILPEEAKKLQGNELYKQYLALRRTFNKSYKDRVQQLVRASGKPYLPYDQVVSTLEREGIQHKLPTGFVGNIGEKSELFTLTGKKLKGYPGSATEVEMNPKYDPTDDNAYVFKARPLPTSKLQRYYTVDYDKHSSAEKFEIVEDLSSSVTKMRGQWLKQLNSRGTRKLCAVVCELAYLTQARISHSAAKTEGTPTYGLSTLLVKHVKISNNQIDIRYKAKKGVPVHYKLKLDNPHIKKVASILKEQAEGKGPNDYLLMTDKEKLIGSNTMKTYLKSIGAPEGTTIHKFRHLRGTELATELLSKSKFKKGGNYTDKEVNDWFTKAMTEVGKELGHVSGDKVTPNTAIANYISPSVMKKFFHDLNVRPNSTVQRAIDRAIKDKG